MAALEQVKRGGTNGYANAVLTVTAVALVAVALQLGGGSPSHAQAAQRGETNNDPLGVPNALAQRQRMIAVLEGIDQRLRSLESKFGGATPLDVRVVNADEISTATVDTERE